LQKFHVGFILIMPGCCKDAHHRSGALVAIYEK